LRIPLSLSVGIGLAALGVAAGLSGPALAASATLRGQEMPAGFGRLELTFDEATPTRIRVANGILVVAFGAAVKIDVARIAKDLPAYVSIARGDPDGRGLRFALARPYKANLIEAGDKVFIDLLPENWTGLLPGPPQEVIASLAERLRLAEARVRDQAAQPAPPRAVLGVRGAALPTLDRLIFQTPPDTALSHEFVDGALRLSFDKPMTVEPGAVRSALPEGVALAAHAVTDAATQLDLTLPQDWRMRSFRDEEGLVVDLVRSGKPPALAAPAGEPQAATPAASPAGARPEAAPAEPASLAGKPAAQPAAAQPLAAPAPRTAPAPGTPPAPTPDPAPQAVKVQVVKHGDGARIDFRFPRPTGAAAFIEAGAATLVFDTRDTIDPAELTGVLPEIVADSTVTREGKVTLVRLRLADQPLTRLSDKGDTWSLAFGEDRTRAAEAIAPRRGVDDGGQTIVSAALPGMTGVHWLEAGPGGMPVAVATATGPTRLLPKPYHFVEFALLPTAHGLAVSPRADDVVVRAGADRALIGRAGGLTVTLDVPAEAQADDSQAPAAPPPLLDAELWRKLKTGSVRDAARALLRDVADASLTRKSEARLALARFYAVNGLMPEAAGPLAVMLADDGSMRGNREALFLKGLIATRMHRNAEALKAWDAAPIREEAEAGLWRALVEQRLGRDAQALVGFRRADAILERYPAEVQGEFRIAKARAALAQQDLPVAEREIGRMADFPSGLVDPEQLALLRAMLDDANGRPEAALNGYKPLFEAVSRPVAAEAQLRAVRLVQTEKRKDITSDEAISRLETVAVTWRGGDLEIEALAELGRLYLDRQRWRDAFMIARRANENFPDNPLTRRMHDETAQRFAELFTGKGAETLPRIDALALFYDFKEFLPIGRRGDEITRLLADRLVELDLLDQASEILNYQMQKRLTGAARSTVAARLAMIALMNGKPAEALRAIHATRLIELPADVRRARLLLETKALSDLSRTDQALELLESQRGAEVDRLRADIYWTGRRWREAGEAHERMLAESWRGEAALTEPQRADVMRAAISYVMAGEALSLDRLRSKFAAKMVDSADARTFAFVTGASRARAADIREMARNAVGADTLSDFMRAYRERYPDYSTAVRQKPKPDAPAAGTPPEAPPAPQGAATPAPATPGQG
jgi:tetratricopeptide (TPR) repeat protein